MTFEMILALSILILMIVLIMTDKMAFGAPPLLACMLLVITGLSTVQEAFAGFVNSSVIMVAGFMVVLAAVEKTSLLGKVKSAMETLVDKGGYKSYVLLLVIVMIGASLAGTGSTGYYVLILSLGFLVWSLVAYKLLPDHTIAEASIEAKEMKNAKEEQLPAWKEWCTVIAFLISVVGMMLINQIGDAAYVIPGLAAAFVLIINVLNFKEVRDNMGAPVILMMAGVIGVADALANTGFTAMIGDAVANVCNNMPAFFIVFVFALLTSTCATFTGSNMGSVYIFAPIAISACMSLGLNPVAAAVAVVISGWNGGYMPIDGMPAMILGMGNYKMSEFWKFSVPMYIIRILALSLGAILIFPM